MALIECPECKHSISEHAEKCIFCGCPMNKIQEILAGKEKGQVPTCVPSLTGRSTYLNYSSRSRALVNELIVFISSNTQLVRVDHSVHVGFRKADDMKMIIVFGAKGAHPAIRFRTKINTSTKTILINGNTLGRIKKVILDNFSPKETKSPIPEKTGSNVQETFFPTRTPLEQKQIEWLKTNLAERVPTLIVKDSRFMLSFRFEWKGEIYSLCWFANGERNRLEFRYYSNPFLRTEKKAKVFQPSKRQECLGIACKAYYDIIFGRKS